MKRNLLALCCLLLASACAREPAQPVSAPESAPAAASPAPAPSAPAAAPAAASVPAALLAPEKAIEQAPAVFKAKFATTKGDFTVEVHRDWAPHGADRFYNLVKLGYFDDAAFFRVIDGFMVQFGIHGLPQVSAKWRDANIPDDPAAGHSNKRGAATFATAGPNTRTTQLFINYADNGNLDGMGFTPFGQVVDGMSVVDSLYKGYGEGAPQGTGPDQGRVQTEGNAYLQRDFPKLDTIKTARLAQ
ncbi:MAG: peptidylprolyl isomerase [Elusimicrobia bacterium]|nr:peptidylprolyl isomerase [Elusimicrobiota bacterium]